MAIYKRYNTRKKNVNKALLIPVAIIIFVFILTVILGSYLGNKARNPKILDIPNDSGLDQNIGTPILERTMKGTFVAPSEIYSFSSEDPFVYASTCLYRDNYTDFATKTDSLLLGEDEQKVSLDAFSIESGTTGLFYVSSLNTDMQVREVVTAYETSLIREFCDSQISEVVLVFDEINNDNFDEFTSFLEQIKRSVTICVPYDILESPICAKFFTALSSSGYNTALMIEDIESEELAKDIEDYAFYFTKYNLRMVLSGEDIDLLSILEEKGILNYQFSSEAGIIEKN